LIFQLDFYPFAESFRRIPFYIKRQSIEFSGILSVQLHPESVVSRIRRIHIVVQTDRMPQWISQGVIGRKRHFRSLRAVSGILVPRPEIASDVIWFIAGIEIRYHELFPACHCRRTWNRYCRQDHGHDNA